MSRYIDVEKLKEELDNFISTSQTYTEYDYGYDDCLAAIQDTLADIPTADVAEVKHGEWTKDDSDGCFCSFCGWYTDYDYDYVTNNGLGNDDFIYCSHCGARMDGGTNDEM